VTFFTAGGDAKILEETLGTGTGQRREKKCQAQGFERRNGESIRRPTLPRVRSRRLPKRCNLGGTKNCFAGRAEVRFLDPVFTATPLQNGRSSYTQAPLLNPEKKTGQ
jgi:hypothetical protein